MATWDLVRGYLESQKWFKSPGSFIDNELKPVYYQMRDAYNRRNGITSAQFEAGVTLDDDKRNAIAERTVLEYLKQKIRGRTAVKFSRARIEGPFFSRGRPAPRSMAWLSFLYSEFMTLIGLPLAVYGTILSLSQQTGFAGFIATEAGDRDVVLDCADDMDTLMNLHDTGNLLYSIMVFTKRGIKLYSSSVREMAETLRIIANNFMYEGIYNLTAIVEELGDNESRLAIIPDLADKITFPTYHVPEKADVGSIVSIQIQRFDDASMLDMQKSSSTVVSVYDGDTFTMANGVKIRLLPINAPEMHEPLNPNPEGILAQQALSNLILNNEVDYYTDPNNPLDRFGRTLAYVFRDDVNLGEWMVDNGYAEYYRITNAWFQTEVVNVDDKYTTLDPVEEENRTTDEPYVNIKIPNYFIPFAAELGDFVYLRVKLTDKVSYLARVECPDPGKSRLYLSPLYDNYIEVPLELLDFYVPNPCDKVVSVVIRFYYACEDEVSEEEGKAVYDSVDGLFGVFEVYDSDHSIRVPLDKIPANVGIGDDAVFRFRIFKPFVEIPLSVTDVNSPTVTLEKGGMVPVSFTIPESLIPFPTAVGERIGIKIGQNVGDYWVADFHARIGNNANSNVTFVVQPDDEVMFSIPLKLVDDVVQDPAMPSDINKMQINDIAYFQIVDKSFTNSFKAYLHRIEDDDGIWKVLPGETTELTIPTVVAEHFLTTSKYAEYPTVTISLKEKKPITIYNAHQLIEIMSTDPFGDTIVKFKHVKFGLINVTFPTRMFSWVPAVGNVGVFSMSYYTGTTSGDYYVDSLTPGSARLIHTTKRVVCDYPLDKLPGYLKRFDVIRVQVKHRGFTPDPLWLFVVIKSLDDGYGKAITQRTDNQQWIYIPNVILPLDAEVNKSVNLIASRYGYRRTYFTAKFHALTLPDDCQMWVEPDYYTTFNTILSLLPSKAVINSVISFYFQKKTAQDTFEPTLEITVITDDYITLKKLDDNKTFTMPRSLLPYVVLPAPDDDITNLVVGTQFRLITAMVKK